MSVPTLMNPLRKLQGSWFTKLNPQAPILWKYYGLIMNLQSVTININLSLLHEIGAGQAAQLERQALFNPAGGRKKRRRVCPLITPMKSAELALRAFHGAGANGRPGETPWKGARFHWAGE